LIELREELPPDCAAVRRVVEAAFGQPDEANLVDALRSEGVVTLSLVCEAHGEIVGHILFSELPIDTGERFVRAAALAPVSVHPQWQRRGLGSALIHRGLLMCRDRGIAAVVVVGDPAYYGRFGFSSETATRLDSPFTGPALQALELTVGVLDGVNGKVRYARAFGVE
jgi:putative acetyltransferase